MKAIELRIGNLVEDINGRTIRITAIKERTVRGDILPSDHNSLFTFAEDIEPIPINAEWLLKCGFECVHEMEAYADKHHYGYANCEGTFTFMPFCTNDTNCHIKIKYVHQLQNLYFALTEKELQFKNDNQ